MKTIPSLVYKNLFIALMICVILTSLILIMVFKMLDHQTATYFIYGACPLLTGLLGGMQLFSVYSRKDSYSNVFFLSMMILNVFFVHGLFNGKVWFLVLFPLIIGIVSVVKFVKDLRQL
ncbi:MAG: hypothetical protein K0S32_3549 [Bacteroidetes bacterium]|jgi:hypothetical protein|nr:hypothetical protein [Bacteroidota bacterium]